MVVWCCGGAVRVWRELRSRHRIASLRHVVVRVRTGTTNPGFLLLEKRIEGLLQKAHPNCTGMKIALVPASKKEEEDALSPEGAGSHSHSHSRGRGRDGSETEALVSVGNREMADDLIKVRYYRALPVPVPVPVPVL